MKFLYLTGLVGAVFIAIIALKTTLDAPVFSPEPKKEPTYSRVVALAPSMSDTLISLGLGDLLVGITIHCAHDAAPLAVTIGSFAEPNFEAIMALKPDLVLGVPHVMAKPVLQRLRDHHIEVFAHQPDTLADIKLVTIELAKKLSVEKKGHELVDAIDLAIRDAHHALKDQRTAQKTALIAVSPAPLVVAGKNTFASEVIEALGLTNLADDEKTSWPVWSLENLLSNPPYFLILANGTVNLSHFKNLFSSLGMDLTMNQIRLVVPDKAIFQTPSPKIVDDIACLTRLLLVE